MGILLALGNSRRKVLLQFFIELLIICIIALVIGAIVSAAILGPVGNAANTAVAPDPNADRFTYVSYTHLDVYKRQLICCATLNDFACVHYRDVVCNLGDDAQIMGYVDD